MLQSGQADGRLQWRQLRGAAQTGRSTRKGCVCYGNIKLPTAAAAAAQKAEATGRGTAGPKERVRHHRPDTV